MKTLKNCKTLKLCLQTRKGNDTKNMLKKRINSEKRGWKDLLTCVKCLAYFAIRSCTVCKTPRDFLILCGTGR